VALPISSIGSTPAIAPVPAGSAPAAKPASGGFAESLAKLVDSVESASNDANTQVANMLDGSGEVHDAMIALQRAELSLQLTVQVRNKLVSAYQEIMRMPV
jgi:flagellar hook-basal body complex protein FliE